jgi:hypothetical protein
LLTYGADISGGIGRGKTTPEMWAIARGFPVIAGLLKESRERAQMIRGSGNTEPFNPAESESKTTGKTRSQQKPTLAGDGLEKDTARVDKPKLTSAGPSDLRSAKETTDNQDFFEEGIRKVGETKWTTTVPGSTTPQKPTSPVTQHFEEGIRKVSRTEATSSKDPESTRKESTVFREGIRKVEQTKPKTSAPLVNAQQQKAEADDFFECVREWSGDEEHHPLISSSSQDNNPPSKPASGSFRTLTNIAPNPGVQKPVPPVQKSESPPMKSSGALPVRGSGEVWSEGIRRVGQSNWNVNEPSELTRHYPKVTEGNYSAFTTLSERLGIKRMHLALVAIFVVALAAFGTVTLLKPFRSAPAQPTENHSEVPLQSAPMTATVPINEVTKSQDSASVSTEQPSTEQPSTEQPSSEIKSADTDISAAAPVKEAASKTSLSKEARQTVGAPDIAKGLKSASRATISPPSSNTRRRKPMRVKKVEDVSETTAPAAITVVPTESRQRTVNVPTNSPAPPTTLIEGSSNKKKVIQWP